MKQIIDLNSNWQFRQIKQAEENWLEANVPGHVHLDLLNHQLIDDLYYRNNVADQQWIENEDWEYKSVFTISENQFQSSNIDLVFDGLDTYADIYLNEKLIFTADNMFCGWRESVKEHLREGENTLRVYFHSVVKETLPQFENNGFEYGANGSQPEPKLSVYSRKVGYHYGWDWGPRFVTYGIWKPAYLEVWNQVRIDNVQFVQHSLDEKLAKLSLNVELEVSKATTIGLKLLDSAGSFQKINKTVNVKAGKQVVRIDFEIENPNWWWTHELGDPFLYNLSLEITQGGQTIDSWEDKVGLRNLEFIHEEDEHGKSCYFKLNGVPVFMKGSNMIPIDYFTTRVTDKDYRDFIQLVVDSNMNMLRIWGGAIYEEDIFYDLCDEMGVLVWQDFMFACAMYPADEVMSKRIAQEAEYNIKRIRNHASLALWCGNNEMDEAWNHWGWQKTYAYTKEQEDLIWGYYCKIFDEILPEAVAKFDPSTAYWPSSPKYGYKDERSRNDGDMHYWGVWFNNDPKESFKEYLPRFMSEYGLQSVPEKKSLLGFSIEEDWSFDSEVMNAHQRHLPKPKRGQPMGGFQVITKYMEDEYVLSENFVHKAYCTQVVQADYLRFAINTHRRNRPYCMGTLYWQINDVWPVVSWASVDYYGRWKASHYAIVDTYKSMIVTASLDDEVIEVFTVNDLLQSANGKLKMKLITFDGETLFEKEKGVVIPENQSFSQFKMPISEMPDFDTKSTFWISSLEMHGELISQDIFYFELNKNLDLKRPDISLDYAAIEGGYEIRLSSNTLVKSLFIDCEVDGKYSDNYFDLLPGEEKKIIFKTGEKLSKYPELLHFQMIS